MCGVLSSESSDLPSSHKTCHSILREKPHAGDVFQVAEVLRDLTWRQKEADHLTTRGKRIYEEAIQSLVGGIAAARAIEVGEAEAEIRERLHAILYS